MFGEGPQSLWEPLESLTTEQTETQDFAFVQFLLYTFSSRFGTSALLNIDTHH